MGFIKYVLIFLIGAKMVFCEKQIPNFVIRTASSLEKIFRNSFKEEWLKKGVDDEIRISGAKGESVSFQIVIIPFKDLKDVGWEIISEIDSKNIKVQPVGYVEIIKNCPRFIKGYPEEEIKTGYWPDPLFSTWKKIEKIQAEQIQPLWVTIDIPEEIKAGGHDITIIISSENEKAKCNVFLNVWDFKLPERTSLKTSFWYGTYQFRVYYPEMKDRIWEIEKKFLKMALDNRITPINNDIISPYPDGSIINITFEPETKKYTFDFTNLKRYLDFIMEENERKGNLINIVHHGFGHGLGFYGYIKEGEKIIKSKYPNPTASFKPMTEEYENFLIQYLTALKKFLKENNWYKYAYVGYIDEPGPPVYESVKWMYPIVKKIVPELPTVSAMNFMPAVKELKDFIDILVPGFFSIFTSENLNYFQELQRQGKEMWGYVCYKTSCIDFQAIDHRILPWLCWKYNLKGFLYWGIYNWMQAGGPAKCKEMFVNKSEDRWPNKAKWEPMDIKNGVAGDGYLIYPSPEGEPWSSIRLENIRDGIEDYEYFCILKKNIEELKKQGKKYQKIIEESEKLLEIGDDIIKDPTEYTRDYKKILERRGKIGQMIEKTSKIIKEKK